MAGAATGSVSYGTTAMPGATYGAPTAGAAFGVPGTEGGSISGMPGAATYAAPGAPAAPSAPAYGPPHPPVDGGVVQQVKVPGVHHKNYEQAAFTMHHPTNIQERAQGAPQYVHGQPSEVDAAAQHVSIDQEQLIAGPVQQRVVEIPTVHEVVTYHDMPEVCTNHVRCCASHLRCS